MRCLATVQSPHLARQSPHEYDQSILSIDANSISNDWPCLACGYNLRGLLANSNCPECGHPAADSLQTRTLYHASPRWLKRLIWAFTVLELAILVNFAALLLPLVRNLGGLLRWHGMTVIYPDDIARILWPLLLIPVACLFLKSEPPIERSAWLARFLPAMVLFHLLLSMALPILRQIVRDPSQIALLLGYGIEPFLVTAEYWLLLAIPIILSTQIPTGPMGFEAKWFRRIFVLLLIIDNLCGLAIELSRIAYLHTGPPFGYWLPAPWGAIDSRIDSIILLVLVPFWLYLPILLIRFSLKLRSPLAWANSHAG